VAVTRLAEDRRARVPFALIGVLLLVGASTYAATITGQGPHRIDRGAEVALERASAGTTAAIRSAVAEAARAAASEPVTDPAETSYGRLLDRDHPFRDTLRLRIFLRLRERLRTARYRRGDVTAAASLPAATTPAELRRAMARIRLRAVENGTALQVTIRNLTVAVREEGRAVARENRTRTVTVSTPVLALHERTRTFERRLNRRPLEGPGLGRRLTARLYPVAWARGYAQYGGLPIANVVSNGHVETSTNGALLETQRAVFGRSDPAGREAMRRATLELGVDDVTAATPVDPTWTERIVPRPNRRVDAPPTLPPRRGTSAPSPDHRIEVDVDPLAGRALTGLRTESVRANRSLDSALRDAYRVETGLLTRRERTYREPRPEPDRPGSGWELADTDRSVDSEVASSGGSTPAVVGDERRFGSFTRHVVLDHRLRWTWERGNETRTTTGTWTERYRVGVTLVGKYAPNGTAPDRPTAPQFERGGVLDGPNLADVPEKARERLVTRQGGRDAIAVDVANRSLGTTEGVVYGDRPAGIRSWIGADLRDLRDRLSNRSVDVSAGEVATYTVNPPAELAATLRDRRRTLIDAPERYRGVAARARIGARAALIDEVVRRLERRAATHERTRRTFGEVLGRVGTASPRSLRRVLETRTTPTPSRSARIDGTPPGGPVRPVPDGSPAYLTVASVSNERATGVPPSRSYHPLSAKNVNLFAAPYGDAADAVTAPGTDRPSEVRLGTAARTLVASEPVADDTVRESRRELERSVMASVDELRRRARRVVRNETRLTGSAADAAVAEAFGRWDGPGRRALAATNGTLAAVIAEAVDRRATTPRPGRADRLETRLDTAVADTLRTPAATVAEDRVVETLTRVKDRAATRASEAATRRLARTRLNETLGAVPAGVPVAPVPGYWYATVNVWEVNVRGAYARFTVRTERGAPTPGSAVRYVRDGSVVRLDVDGDGRPERLGRDERVDFRTRTVVAVAVPPYRSGVGDVDGNADERAGTWPEPGCTSWEVADCSPSE
jgi:hypothetical protein